MLQVSKDLDKPIIAGDFARQVELLTGLRDRLARVKPCNLASFEFDPRTRLFTALLRIGRQTLPDDAPPEKVTAKNQAFAELGALWKALGEEERAGQAFAQAGEAKAALTAFEKAGTWEGAAELHEKDGRFREAAKLFEDHGDVAAAARLLDKAKDFAGAVKLLLGAGNLDGAKEALKKMPTDQGRKLLTQLGAGDLLLDFLAGRGKWEEIGKLYQKAGMGEDAAQAFIKAGRTHMAIHAYRAVNDEAGARKLIDAEIDAARATGDAHAIAAACARWNLFVDAAEAILSAGAAGQPAGVAMRSADVDKAMGYIAKAGSDPEALKFAQRRAAAAREAGDLLLAGRWHEKTGVFEEAARTYIEGNLPAEAFRLFEQLGDWRSAAACAEQLGNKERAAELYNRIGDYESVERVRGG